MKNKLILIIIFLFALCVVFTGCSASNNENAAESIVEEVLSTDDVDVNLDNDQMEITIGDEGSVEMATSLDNSVDIPKDYPENILPIYKNSFIYSISTINEGGKGYIVTFASKDEYEKLVEFYKDVVKNYNNVTSILDSNDLYNVMAEYEDYLISISVIDEEDENGNKCCASISIGKSE
ncbi:MAG: hypothetical protein ACOWWH_11740 [Eubacteriaceae bacterium]